MEKEKLIKIAIKDLPLLTQEKVRFNDTDSQGHVNNAVFPEYLETGRLELLYKIKDKLEFPQASFVTVSMTIDLLNEIKWPGSVEIGTGLTGIGNSSLKFYQVLYQNEKPVAVATSVLVQIDALSRKSKPLSDTSKAALSQYLLEK